MIDPAKFNWEPLAVAESYSPMELQGKNTCRKSEQNIHLHDIQVYALRLNFSMNKDWSCLMPHLMVSRFIARVAATFAFLCLAASGSIPVTSAQQTSPNASAGQQRTGAAQADPATVPPDPATAGRTGKILTLVAAQAAGPPQTSPDDYKDPTTLPPPPPPQRRRSLLSPYAEAALAAMRAPLDHLTPVTDEMLRNPPPGDWLNWRRTYDGWAYSPLTQINRKNVKDLKVAWTFSLASRNDAVNESTPLVHDGVMFLWNFGETIQALDAKTGTLLWQYFHSICRTTIRRCRASTGPSAASRSAATSSFWRRSTCT